MALQLFADFLQSRGLYCKTLRIPLFTNKGRNKQTYTKQYYIFPLSQIIFLQYLALDVLALHLSNSLLSSRQVQSQSQYCPLTKQWRSRDLSPGLLDGKQQRLLCATQPILRRNDFYYNGRFLLNLRRNGFGENWCAIFSLFCIKRNRFFGTGPNSHQVKTNFLFLEAVT